MAICDVKASSIDNAISAMEGAIRLLKEHRIKVLLYKDTANDVKELIKGLRTRSLTLEINTESYGSAVRELMTEVMAAMPSAPEKRTVRVSQNTGNPGDILVSNGSGGVEYKKHKP